MDSFPRSSGASRAADIKVHVFIDLSVHAGRSLLLMSVYNIKAVAESLASYSLKINQLPLQKAANSPTLRIRRHEGSHHCDCNNHV